MQRSMDLRIVSTLLMTAGLAQTLTALIAVSYTHLDVYKRQRLIKEIVVHERIDEDKTRHISIEIHFNLKPIPEVEQVTA